VCNVITLIFYFSPSSSPLYRAIGPLFLPIALNFMACKVYRLIKFGQVSDAALVVSQNANSDSIQIVPMFPRNPRAPRISPNVLSTIDVSMTQGVPQTENTEMFDAEPKDTSYKRDLEGFNPV
jgi:hypothetical protein